MLYSSPLNHFPGMFSIIKKQLRLLNANLAAFLVPILSFSCTTTIDKEPKSRPVGRLFGFV